MKGIVVIGHGSRSKEACDIFFKTVGAIRAKMGTEVEGCFMEISEPDIPTIIRGFYEKGIKDITVLPYFLYNGIHIKEDVPQILNELKKELDGLTISMAEPIGFHDLLVDILIDRAEGITSLV
ncbi:sirohydrochlorin cobaltochelatase [Oxobacter pfennigii]|uniref:Sirohydrochlorin cobaltochelatase n=1 Tax=Oxobacter pfennigii TaxID=36849 RepID=A0A0P8W744_9CLOT|nr:CbiX/SirB N-terminal domain-containing protein [Oxobacter pfennigii]KPU43611.1 sirohydrochlorin cobaltochelatase [Oxobacter pfennigii]